MNLQFRSQSKELIDEKELTPQEAREFLDDLVHLNRAFNPIKPFLQAMDVRESVHVVDVGCGAGDILFQLSRRFPKHEFTGLDICQNSIFLARERHSMPNVRFLRANYKSWAKNVDILINSLMLHHLDEQEVIEFIQWMDRTSKVGWVISDLHRHAIPYYFVKYYSKVGGFGRFVSHDGPLSVARGFRREDLERIIRKSRVKGIELQWQWPFRWVLSKTHEI